MLSPEPPKHRTPPADADAPGKQRRGKGKPFCRAVVMVMKLVALVLVVMALVLVVMVTVVLVMEVVVLVGCTPWCEVLGRAAACFHQQPH